MKRKVTLFIAAAVLSGAALVGTAAVATRVVGARAAKDPAVSAPMISPRHFASMAPATARADSPAAVSTNWAGYVVADASSLGSSPAGPSGSPTAFTSVTGTWKQPSAKCTPGKPAYSATWVGLGGFAAGSQALEQTGTSVDCGRRGKATYYAWYELLPAPSVTVKLKIAQGDTITTSVNVNGSAVLFQIKDRTRHTSFTKQLIMTTPDLSSAEWIEEAPSTCTSSGQCRVLPLANFGSISIGKAATIGNGHPGTVSDPAWAASAVQLVPDSGSFGPTDASQSTAGATPSALSANGRSFAVTWQASATANVANWYSA